MTWLISMHDTTSPYMRDMIHSYAWHDLFIYAPTTWPFYMYVGDVTHLYASHDLSIYAWHDWFICITRPIHICAIWLNHIHAKTYSYMRDQNSLIHINGTTYPYIRDMLYSHVRYVCKIHSEIHSISHTYQTWNQACHACMDGLCHLYK